jgi:hypothetical protein
MMKKFSMGMMLSSLLVIQIGCGEEAPTTPAADTAAAMESAADAAKECADAAKEGADAAKEGADAVKEVSP